MYKRQDVHAALAIESGVPAAVFAELDDVRASGALDERETVSYTHLTLPTSDLV